MIKKLTLTALAICALNVSATPTFAAEGAVEPPHQHWHFDGPRGMYDKAALQRGFLVYKNVCAACHSLKRVAFRNLDGLGYDESQIKAIASEFTITDGPNDQGEMFDRPGRPADRFPAPFANPQAAKASNNGAFPPDMSLLVNARHHGADYIYALLAEGYVDAPEHTELAPGQYYNKYMAGHVISMAAPLSDGIVAYPDGSPETVKQYAKDVTEFLKYAADPHMEARKNIGMRAMIFLFFFCLVFFMAKKKIWKDVEH